MRQGILPQFRFEETYAQAARDIAGSQQNPAGKPSPSSPSSSLQFVATEFQFVGDIERIKWGGGRHKQSVIVRGYRTIDLAGKCRVQLTIVGPSQQWFQSFVDSWFYGALSIAYLRLSTAVYVLIGNGRCGPSTPTNRSKSNYWQGILMLNRGRCKNKID